MVASILLVAVLPSCAALITPRSQLSMSMHRALLTRRSQPSMMAYSKKTDTYDTKRLSGARTKFVNADGRMYAPWLAQQVDDEGMLAARRAREARLSAARASAKRDGTGSAEGLGEGLASELGGGGMRLAASVLAAPATAEEHGHVEITWANAGGNLVVEKRTSGGGWEAIARGARSPVVDDAAEAGDALYRVKNGGTVVAQVGLVVESRDQRAANAAILGALGAALVAAVGFGLSFDAIPKV